MTDTPHSAVIYKANLQRCGALITETLTLIEEYDKINNWEDLKQKVITKNILNKKSSTTINGILQCIKKRYKDIDGLPNLKELSHFISSDIPEKSKIQVLFPYMCKTDPLIEQYIIKMIFPHFELLNRPKIKKETFLEFLTEEMKTHPELEKWSDYLQKRWIRGLISVLRNFNLMSTAPNFELTKPNLRIETFTFFCLWLLFSGKSGIELIQNGIYQYFLLSNSEIEILLEESQRKGWLSYTHSGDIISITTEFESLEDWIDVLK